MSPDDSKSIRSMRISASNAAKERLGDRPNRPDTPEEIAETEAVIKSMTARQNKIIAEQ